MYLQIIFYSLGIYLIFILCGLQSFSIKSLIKCLMPITFGEYWFMSCYIVLYLLSPFINKFLNNLKRKEHINYLLLMIFIFSILTTFTTMPFYGNELIQFIMFYSIGAYFKKYPKNKLSKNKNINNAILVITIILLILSTVFFDLLGTKIELFNAYSIYFFNRTSILSIMFCISLFNIFINKQEFKNKLINVIASCALGVYLIHDNNLVRKVIWSDLFNNAKYVNSNFLILHMVLVVLIVYVVCTIIEYIRKNTIEMLTNKLIVNKIDVIENKFKTIYKKIIK